ncbi:ATP synthase subunit I [Castellaniella sp.]|uniref:ATP synthase subunit I n=1 Tax=Castellaniella sp. TaxID=1955812 RepID=UPI002AFF24D2|nr:ATP synthase subunit I [Castellaniella sp.]
MRKQHTSDLAGGVGDETGAIQPLVLSDQDRAQIARRSQIGLYRALAAQAFMGMLVVLGAWGIAGKDAGASALIGAAAYFVPNALFALRLLLGYFGPKRPGSIAFFLGEFLKLFAVAGIVVLVAWQWGSWLNWLAFLLGLLGVMKGYVVLLALRRLP